MADDDDSGGGQQQIDDRFAAIEQTQAEQGGMLQQILERLGGGGNPSGEGKTGDPALDIGAEVRKQLADKEVAERAAADAKSKDDRLAAAEQRLAELAEKPPGPLPRRIEQLMGWR